jgi:hypothetical protein
MTDMPLWRSHKIVEAAPITSISRAPDPCWVEVSVSMNTLRFDVPPNFFARGLPSMGDYFVRYDDGYVSWSPKKAFDDGYVQVNN